MEAIVRLKRFRAQRVSNLGLVSLTGQNYPVLTLSEIFFFLGGGGGVPALTLKVVSK